MLTGPQKMPVFNDNVMTPQDKKRHHRLPARRTRTEPNPGGFEPGPLGPVTEGLFAWLGRHRLP